MRIFGFLCGEERKRKRSLSRFRCVLWGENCWFLLWIHYVWAHGIATGVLQVVLVVLAGRYSGVVVFWWLWADASRHGFLG